MRTSKFTLFKRESDREAPYYVRFQYRGARYWRCTETHIEAKAQVEARKIREAVVADVIRGEADPGAATRLRGEAVASVAELLAAYEAAPSVASPRTRLGNRNALCQLLRVGKHGDDPARIPVSAIGEGLALDWFKFASRRAETAGTPRKALSIRRSANSRFIQARSLFKPALLREYKRQRVWHASYAHFVEAGAEALFGKLPRSGSDIPDDQVVAAVLAAWQKLDDRDLYLAIGHALAFGLRKHEIIQAAWGWHQQGPGYPVIDGRAWDPRVKDQTGHVRVRALDPWYSLMRSRIAAEGWRGQANDLIISQGSATYRTDGLYRSVSTWLRQFGWRTQKALHALRGYAGSQIAMKYGIYEASGWLRHKSVNVTESHYTAYVKQFKPADMEDLPARWAVTELSGQAPALRVVGE